MAEKIVELQDIINIRELPRNLKEGDMYVLVYDGLKDGKMFFAFKNINNILEELPI